jgi:potassium inwardly-rectifying channel subfamily J
MGILFLIYAMIVFFFAFVYLGVSTMGAPPNDPDSSIKHSFCGMDINNHMEALYFSLSTMTTIGYGVSDYYFGDCWTPLLLVLWQSCAAITFNAVAIGLLFQRISRGQKRSKSILFSDKAVIRRVRGVPYLMFRVGELRRHHLIEASVRAYCLRHVRLPLGGCSQDPSVGRVDEIETIHFLARNLSLQHPDDTLGPHILMSLPQVIVHKLDEKSPLVPPQPAWYDAGGFSHCSTGAIENEETKSFLSDRDAEIIVLLEGTDELTGSALQARHSYRVGDIAWDHGFAPCVFPRISQEQANHDQWSWLRQRNCESRVAVPACTIDFSKFHDIVRVPPDCDTCAFVPQ